MRKRYLAIFNFVSSMVTGYVLCFTHSMPIFLLFHYYFVFRFITILNKSFVIRNKFKNEHVEKTTLFKIEKFTIYVPIAYFIVFILMLIFRYDFYAKYFFS